MLADYVLVGGGGVENLDEMPEGCRRGGNEHAYFGGLRMWEECSATHLDGVDEYVNVADRSSLLDGHRSIRQILTKPSRPPDARREPSLLKEMA